MTMRKNMKLVALFLIGALLGGGACLTWLRQRNTETMLGSFVSKQSSIAMSDVVKLGLIAADFRNNDQAESVKQICTLLEVQASRMRKALDEAEPIFVQFDRHTYETAAQPLWQSQVSMAERNARTTPCVSK